MIAEPPRMRRAMPDRDRPGRHGRHRRPHIAMSARSLTITRAPDLCARATRSWHVARKSPLDACLHRIWIKRAPPGEICVGERRHCPSRPASHLVVDDGVERREVQTASARFLSLSVARGESLHELRAQAPGKEIGIVQDAQMHRNSGLDAFHDGHLQRALHPHDRLMPIAAV